MEVTWSLFIWSVIGIAVCCYAGIAVNLWQANEEECERLQYQTLGEQEE